MHRLSLITGLLALAFVVTGFADPSLPGRTPSGILVDRTPPLARLEQLDGRPGASRANLGRWRQAVFELRAAAEGDLDWPAARALARSAREATGWRTVPLGVVHARYDRLAGETRVEPAEIFAFAPLRERIYHGADIRFVLDPAELLTHRVDEPDAWWFDAGDGAGLRRLVPGQPVDVSYAGTGTRPLRLEAHYADGSVLGAQSEVQVIRGATPDPTETWAVTASETFEGLAASGSAHIYLADGHVSLTNPVVVIEGFDIDNSLDWPALYELLNQQNLLEDLRSAGYDAVVLDFDEAVEPIQRNGLLVAELLQMVNAATAPDQSMALIGASMGGLVSRYALLWMEDQAIPHRVRNWITFDAPHDGANLPLGLQAFVEFFADQADEAEFLLQQLRSGAARQMLLYHYDSIVGTSAAADPLKAALEAEFASLGGWPEAPRRVSVVNGSGSMTDQGFAAGAQILEWEYSGFPINDLTGNVWAVPDGGSATIFDGEIDVFIIGGPSETLTIAGTLPWDNAPGGYRATMQQVADLTAPYGDIVAPHPAHSFIPTVSALALGTNDPFFDIDGAADLPGLTPFDQVYYPAVNEEHVEITPASRAWFLAEIQSGIVVSPASGDTGEPGGTATFTVAATFAPSAPVTISLTSSDPGEGLVPASVVLPAGVTTPQEVTVTGVDDLLVDGPQPYVIVTGPAESADPAYDGIDPEDVALVNTDDDIDLLFGDGFESPP